MGLECLTLSQTQTTFNATKFCWTYLKQYCNYFSTRLRVWTKPWEENTSNISQLKSTKHDGVNLNRLANF